MTTDDIHSVAGISTTSTSAVAVREQAGIAALGHVLGTGDLAKLSNEERVGHYLRLCRSLGLNPLSRPFDWIQFDGKLALYPNQSCAAQLRRQHQIRIEVTRREPVGEMFCVEVKGTTPDGREDFATKYVPLSNKYGRLAGQDYANALMKCETGAKRRLTFSMVGLAVRPDPEEATVGWKPVIVDGTGAVLRHPSPEQRYLAEQPAAAKAIGEPVFEDAGISDDADAPSQAVRPEEIARPAQPRPQATLRPTKEQIDQWQKTWFALVDGTSLDNDASRHDFVGGWTGGLPGWPPSKQTNSLPTMFGRMTVREAEAFLSHVRGVVEGEQIERQRAAEEALSEARGQMPPTEAQDEEPF